MDEKKCMCGEGYNDSFCEKLEEMINDKEPHCRYDKIKYLEYSNRLTEEDADVILEDEFKYKSLYKIKEISLENLFNKFKEVNPVASIENSLDNTMYKFRDKYNLTDEEFKLLSKFSDNVKYDLNQNARETDKVYPNLRITLPNSFFKYYGINPVTADGFHFETIIDGKKRLVSLIEEKEDEYGIERISYEG